MSSPFGARRKARVVGQEDEPSDSPMSGTDSTDQEPVFKRPSNKTKKRSSTRLSFGPGGTSMDDDEGSTEVFTPKKSSLSRQAAERNALRKSASLASLRRNDVPTPNQSQNDRPSYSKEHLAELKNSTPSTPRSQRSPSPQASFAAQSSLDITAKFGTDLTRYERLNGTAIPTDAEVQEKKARRARLAKEQKYKPSTGSGSEDDDNGADFLNDDPRDRDSDEDEFRSHRDVVSLQEKPSKYGTATARLAADDDEDLLDDSVQYGGTAGRVKIGRAAERERAARERVQRAEQIEEAQQSESESSEGEDEGERDRRMAYDDVQTRAGMAGLNIDSSAQDRRDRARTPPKTTPLPTFASVLERLGKKAQELEEESAAKIRALEDAQKERAEIKDQEAAVQKLLDEVAAKWKEVNGKGGTDINIDYLAEERPMFGASIGAGGGPGLGASLRAGLESRLGVHGEERGLESLGGTPIRGGTPSTPFLDTVNGNPASPG